MGKFYDQIPEFLLGWIPQQAIFWVATAALAQDGHVNVSPKGLQGSFHVVSPARVWYEDMTGSGSETIAHLRENGRITVMFSAFEGAPRTVRLFGTGVVHQWGTPEYDTYVPAGTRKPGSRSIIVVDVHKVGTSCGYAVPYFAFQGERHLFPSFCTLVEKRDEAFNAEHAYMETDGYAPKGMKAYWKAHSRSIDGLPSLECYANPKPLTHDEAARADRPYATAIQSRNQQTSQLLSERPDSTVRTGGIFITGAAVGAAIAVFYTTW